MEKMNAIDFWKKYGLTYFSIFNTKTELWGNLQNCWRPNNPEVFTWHDLYDFVWKIRQDEVVRREFVQDFKNGVIILVKTEADVDDEYPDFSLWVEFNEDLYDYFYNS